MLLVLCNVPLIMDTPLADEPPLIEPVVAGADHVNVVPAGTIPLATFVGVTLNVTPLHVTLLIAVIAGVGLIFTVTLNTNPVQLPVIGVTKYVAVLTLFVVLASVPLMLTCGVICDSPPVKPAPVGADHENSVPAGTTPSVPFVGVTVN